MLFSEYAQGLSPFIAGGMSEATYFTELIGNFIDDAAMDACAVLKREEDTRYRYIIGKRKILPKYAQYIYDHRNLGKVSEWLEERMDESDSEEAVGKWLEGKGVVLNDDGIADACAALLETVLLLIIRQQSMSSDSMPDSRYDFELLNSIKTKIESLPRPAEVPVPKEATPEEHDYIVELYHAYGDAVDNDAFDSSNFDEYPEYRDDLDERRVDFYAAETIHRGVMELSKAGLASQYDVLKDETYSNVKDTERGRHPNGYERMLAVMTQAVGLPVTNYILSNSPYWISGKIKKGVCHQLVIDGKLKWVKKKK